MSRRAPCTIAAAAVVALLYSSGTARAQSTQSVLFACINPGNGVVRVVPETEECKSTETRLQWNIVGQRGEQGPQGAQGIQGVTGATGAIGATGAKGDTGAQGAPGEKGDKGDQGLPGAVGPVGPAGAPGDTGVPGAVGATGAAGLPGAPGEKGEKGDKGDRGADGATGSQGAGGFQTTLGYEFFQTGSLSTSNVVPSGCSTGSYVAGKDEMAIINMGLQAYSGAANHLMLAPMVSENGMNKFLVSQYAIQYAPAGTSVSTSSVASMALTPGATYRFMTGARLSDTAGGSTNMTCRAVIVIAKRQ